MNQNTYKASSLGDLLLVFRRNMHEIIKKEGLKYDLTFSQAEVMRYIGPTGKKTMKNIADFLKVAPPSATEIVSDLESRGLVKREGDKMDRRIVFIVATPRAKRFFDSMYRQKDIFFKKMISKLSKKDQDTLERIIRQLIS